MTPNLDPNEIFYTITESIKKRSSVEKKENGCTASKKFFHLVWVKKEGGGWGARKCKRKIVQVSRLFFCFHFGQCFWCSSTLFSPLMDCDYFMATWLIVCITIIGLLFCFLMSWILLPKNKTENAILPTSKNWYKKMRCGMGYPCCIQEGLDTDLIKSLPTTLTSISCQDNLLILCWHDNRLRKWLRSRFYLSSTLYNRAFWSLCSRMVNGKNELWWVDLLGPEWRLSIWCGGGRGADVQMAF